MSCDTGAFIALKDYYSGLGSISVSTNAPASEEKYGYDISLGTELWLKSGWSLRGEFLHEGFDSMRIPNSSLALAGGESSISLATGQTLDFSNTGFRLAVLKRF